MSKSDKNITNVTDENDDDMCCCMFKMNCDCEQLYLGWIRFDKTGLFQSTSIQSICIDRDMNSDILLLFKSTIMSKIYLKLSLSKCIYLTINNSISKS
jgi:hypothetical protein